ncbi:MAG: hypothetical protein HGA22_13370, partial [Clostridiales bacterium]|nr:hypothetical protein [Clostridiales bacterium]
MKIKDESGHGRREAGSVTVEAAIVFPVFLCAVLTVIFLIKAVYVHELVQQGLNDTARRLSSISCLYYKSGLLDWDGSIQKGLESNTEYFTEQTEILSGLFDIFGIDTGGEIPEVMGEITEKLSLGAFNDMKTSLFTPLTRGILMDSLKAEGATAEERLSALGVKGGFAGLDLNESAYFNGNEDIDLIVRYTLELPLPVRFFGDFSFVQRASCRAWTGGDDPAEAVAGSVDKDGIWLLDNFTRGKKLREIFGGDLPPTFPVLSGFKDGTALMIKSMDITAGSYSNEREVTD